jgi:hypothetical protein
MPISSRRRAVWMQHMPRHQVMPPQSSHSVQRMLRRQMKLQQTCDAQQLRQQVSSSPEKTCPHTYMDSACGIAARMQRRCAAAKHDCKHVTERPHQNACEGSKLLQSVATDADWHARMVCASGYYKPPAEAPHRCASSSEQPAVTLSCYRALAFGVSAGAGRRRGGHAVAGQSLFRGCLLRYSAHTLVARSSCAAAAGNTRSARPQADAKKPAPLKHARQQTLRTLHTLGLAHSAARASARAVCASACKLRVTHSTSCNLCNAQTLNAMEGMHLRGQERAAWGLLTHVRVT